MCPFLAGTRNSGLVRKELFQLAADGGSDVVAGYLTLDLVKLNIAVVAEVRLGLLRGFRLEEEDALGSTFSLSHLAFVFLGEVLVYGLLRLVMAFALLVCGAAFGILLI